MLKRWPSDKFKENFETYLKLHCYAAIIKLAMKYLDACMASPEKQVIYRIRGTFGGDFNLAVWRI